MFAHRTRGVATRKRPSVRVTGAAHAPVRSAPMGYNPFRKQVRRQSDLVFLVAAVVVTALVVVWAFVG